MATYTYQCMDCGAPFDVQSTIQEKEFGKGEKFMCPKCQSENIKQEFSVIHFIKNVFKSDQKGESCCSSKNNRDAGGSCCR